MNARKAQTPGTKRSAKAAYDRIVRTIRNALNADDDMRGALHQKVLQLIPLGIYQHHGGDCYLVIGVELHRRHENKQEIYRVHTVGCSGADRGKSIRWGLISWGNPNQAWFDYLEKDESHTPLFTLVAAVTIPELVSKHMKKR